MQENMSRARKLKLWAIVEVVFPLVAILAIPYFVRSHSYVHDPLAKTLSTGELLLTACLLMGGVAVDALCESRLGETKAIENDLLICFSVYIFVFLVFIAYKITEINPGMVFHMSESERVHVSWVGGAAVILYSIKIQVDCITRAVVNGRA